MTGSGFGSSCSVFVASCPSCPRCIGSRASLVLPGFVSFPTRVTLQSPPDLFQTIELPSLSPSNAIVSVVCLLVHALPASCLPFRVSCCVLVSLHLHSPLRSPIFLPPLSSSLAFADPSSRHSSQAQQCPAGKYLYDHAVT